jgi:hypothetical protein
MIARLRACAEPSWVSHLDTHLVPLGVTATAFVAGDLIPFTHASRTVTRSSSADETVRS